MPAQSAGSSTAGEERRTAQDLLERALCSFDELGAPLWAERARDQLARVRPDGGRAGELTATEKRVAHLAASGLTNRQVAETLFVSPKTVEATLARVYRKLGIRTRAELGRTITDCTNRPDRRRK